MKQIETLIRQMHSKSQEVLLQNATVPRVVMEQANEFPFLISPAFQDLTMWASDT